MEVPSTPTNKVQKITNFSAKSKPISTKPYFATKKQSAPVLLCLKKFQEPHKYKDMEISKNLIHTTRELLYLSVI